MTRHARKKSFELGYGLIYDVRNVSLLVGISDAYSFPRDIATIYDDPIHRKGKVDIVFNSDMEFWEFFETTTRNARVYVMLFRDKKDAVEWLSEKEPSDQPDADDDG